MIKQFNKILIRKGLIMTINKTKSDTFLVTLYYPSTFRQLTGQEDRRFRKTCKTLDEAHRLETLVLQEINNVVSTGFVSGKLNTRGNISFKDFFEQEWFPKWSSGVISHREQAPKVKTIENARTMIEKHIIPVVGNISMKLLNAQPDRMEDLLTDIGKYYVNVKTMKRYIVAIFNHALARQVIDVNWIEPAVKFIRSTKKQEWRKRRLEEGLFLSVNELRNWLAAIMSDVNAGLLDYQDYVMFRVTAELGDRKSESYALRWSHINLVNQWVLIDSSLDRHQQYSDTKEHKATQIRLPKDLTNLLVQWKTVQFKNFSALGITINYENQAVFTSKRLNKETNKLEYNQLPGSNYLNYRLNVTMKRHPDLPYLYPHKLRHTFATLSRQNGESMDNISAALTHSGIGVTKRYVNTPDVVDNNVFQCFENNLKGI